ncbi:MAG: HPr kinase/phosphorylase [Gammaproteobacteria bacterium]|nr:HPr kinase/phosphorylase [Gammaproteobacteria bacterium]NIR98806.1 HPr kinase/phosphorylase [Gammaproteobacteria bacterium]NIT64516.1 HPr kinase/phosphorylase [Gammaproteobacteria bacterium]NIV21436.1 HPr kinase/phosphorylase [Gammaproteobacteria bacterium]NIX11306.1 HPr kinase/phosphorylase [Gammaproteobacteria bacterium]
MTNPITVRDLLSSLQSRLQLEWVGGETAGDRPIQAAPTESGITLVGHLNLIHPHRVQVLGARELDYAASLDRAAQEDLLQRLFSADTDLVLVADDQCVPAELTAAADAAGIPLLASALDSDELVTALQYYLGNILAEKIILHGVFMEVMGMGVLLTGEAGIGKSELALELISRGHRLIADDAPEFARVAPDIINGTCPNVLREFLEVRGLGMINVRAMFGDSAIKQNKYLRLIIQLEHMNDEGLLEIDRLRGSRRTSTVLGVEIPEITLPVAPGRNLAVLVEIAVRNHLLALKGYEAHRDFVRRQRNAMNQDEP